MKSVAAIFRFIWRALDGLRKVLHVILLLFVFGLVWVAVSPPAPIVPLQAALVVAPEGTLVEQLSGDPFERALAEAYGQAQPETLMRDLVDSIEQAGSDDRIKALVLDLGSMMGGGVAKLEELSLAVRNFRNSGKPVIALGEFYDQSQYYVAAHADEIYLDPEGMVLIDGFGYYRTYMKDAIDKLAVDVNIFRAGEFKSFTDQFSRNDMSENEREESRTWLDSLWGTYQGAVTQARNLESSALAGYADGSVALLQQREGDAAAMALASGLVTDLRTRAQVEERLVQLTGLDEQGHTFKGIDHRDYMSAVRSQRVLEPGGDNSVGIVVASGEILDGEQPPGTIGGESTSELLRQARFNDAIRAVVLRIDSPGGSVFASEMIRREVEALKAAGKPVIASMSSTAASGGYYIAMDADEIWASPATLTGSIGVFAIFPTLERTFDKLGLSVDGLGTTKLSGAFRLDRSLSEEARKLLQLTVDHEYRNFIGRVAAGRSKSVEEIDQVAQGRVWSGSDAQRAGLVDQLGSFKDALDAAARRAGIEGDYRLEYVEPPLSWRQLLAQEVRAVAGNLIRILTPEQSSALNVRRALSPLQAELGRWARFAEVRGPFYYCMCSLD